MKAKFCLPIIKKSIKEVEKEIEENMKNFDMYEVWIDYLSDAEETIIEGLESLSSKLPNRLIITFRRKNGDAIRMDFEKRAEILRFFSNKKTFIDLDIEKQKNDLDFVKEEKINCQIIASFHDYKKTPRTSSLVKIIDQMSIYQPAIYKIATFCQTEKQAVSLLHLLLELKEQKKDCIVLGMGKLGQITRIFGSMWGNEIIFAPLSNNMEVAPEQLTKEQLDKIFAIVEESYGGK